MELGDGIMRKLPFNNGANYLEAADKFCVRERLSRVNVEQIVQFLKTNALAHRTRDFDGSEAKKAAEPKVPGCLPHMTHLFFEAANVAGA